MTRSAALFFACSIAGCAAKSSQVGEIADTRDDSSSDGDSDAATDDGSGIVLPDGSIDCAALGAGEPLIGGGARGPSGFPPRCNPRTPGVNDGEYHCCSDDPAAEAGGLPNYMGHEISDAEQPYFSAVNNALGTWGLCVRTHDVPADVSAVLIEETARNCPVPCNPTWSDEEIAQVCGSDWICCQTQELQPEDCVLDPETSVWRPVRGDDIGKQYESDETVTNWAPSAHATHQDPGGEACRDVAGGDVASGVFQDCVRQLSVADQRGYCMLLFPNDCPLARADYLDACEQINLGLIPPPR